MVTLLFIFYFKNALLKNSDRINNLITNKKKPGQILLRVENNAEEKKTFSKPCHRIVTWHIPKTIFINNIGLNVIFQKMAIRKVCSGF